ncbi:MAG: hypothetical protein HQL03_01520 [Nitrospirae bacterium]|nr:hypothetical protein [Nitrospirota bacterium]MBF0591348.1 hypothetical protein [Nitrospirota bacterium]
MDKGRSNVDIIASDYKKRIMSSINFLRSSFSVTLDNMYEINELSEKVLLDMVSRGKDMHNEAEQVLVDFFNNTRKSRDELKSVVECGFEQIERLFKDSRQ